MLPTNGHGKGDEHGAFDLEDVVPPAPPLPGEVVVRASVDEVLDSLAADLVIHARNCVRQFGDFHLALSGAGALDHLYRRLMYDPDFRQLPWRRTHVWFVWERCVPFDDVRSAFRVVNETVGDHADIPPEQFHPIFAESADAVTEYETLLRDALAWREKGQDRLDYVLLSMDAAGGTMGLAPGGLDHDDERLVQRDTAADVVTLTFPFINAARFVAILATGAEHADVLRRLGEAAGGNGLPVAHIAPVSGELKWYLDGAACGGGDG